MKLWLIEKGSPSQYFNSITCEWVDSVFDATRHSCLESAELSARVSVAEPVRICEHDFSDEPEYKP